MAKILIIDDNFEIRDIYGKFFKFKGWEVFEAEDGIEGVKSIHKNEIDLVLLDMMMPNLDGFSVLEAIKQISHFPVTIISFSNMGESITNKVLEKGADLSLIKSDYTPFTLYSKIEELFRKKGLPLNIKKKIKAKQRSFIYS